MVEKTPHMYFKIKCFILFLFLIFFICFVSSEELDSGMDVDLKIINYGSFTDNFEIIPSEYHIVGDYFVYNFSFKAHQRIEDLISIRVISPKNITLNEEKFKLNLDQNQFYSFIPRSFKNDSFAAFPLTNKGVYILEVCSKNRTIFYKQFTKMVSNTIDKATYVWESPCIHFSFDTMTQSEYFLLKKQNMSQDIIMNQNEKMIDLTKWLIFLTITMVFFILIQLSSFEHSRKFLGRFLFYFFTGAIILFGIILIYWAIGNKGHPPLVFYFLGGLMCLGGIISLINYYKNT